MVKSKIQEEVNNQIQAEFQSAYIYLGFSAWFESKNLNGFAHWMKMQWQEEIDHAMRLYNHLLRRGGNVELKTLEAPEIDVSSAKEVFEQALEHEEYITGRIHELYALAQEEKDYPLTSLLHWFIDEQVEEEDVTGEILERLKMIDGDPAALLDLDRELAQRQPEEEGEEQEGE
ncbi:ferritin [Aliifodinibius sp. S!AR15-10]|uniref:ferritin n=1 Tax=Aliifodinibius sp. S!AR15-10 TaxID=2950437 RepID=UPI0028630865|nr:ferritin [Aliifodinibius sp. S!AR15-10]MDR8393153.1 ferritin [Aliifodinibius sp. S!AR15-10]